MAAPRREAHAHAPRLGGSTSPPLSVVMPVRNAEPFLDAAIASIVNQTFPDFEFVILDDASADASYDIAAAWAARDTRILLERSCRPLGLAGSSNAVVALARAGIVARMDADDLSHPDRLRRQWRAMAVNPDLAAVGALADGIDAAGRTVRPRDRWRIVRRSRFVPFPHGSIMFRREIFNAAGGYRDVADAEDFDLFARLASLAPVVTLPDLLYHYRYHGGNSTVARVRPPATGGSPRSRVTHPCYARGAMRLWSGARPGVWRELSVDRVNRWTPSGLGMLLWAGWGEVSPATLRWCLRAATTVRDRACGLWIPDGKAYRWRFER